jgi:DNA modification methylase
VIQLFNGDALTTLKTLPSKSVNCVITSPPYYGLRKYTDNSQELGMEETREQYITNLITVFHEARRVLTDDGTCFCVIGDSYSRGTRKHAGRNVHHNEDPDNKRNYSFDKVSDLSVPGKSLMLIPQYLGIAFQNDNWIVRQDIIWHKTNPMVESVKDRFTRAHEVIWFLVKDRRYKFDQQLEDVFCKNAQNHHRASYVTNGKRNKRDVFSTSTNKDRAAKNAHFATFPKKLIQPLLLAGCPEGGTVLDMFAGSGTVGEVAEENGRNAVLIELSTDYCKIIEERCHVLINQ